MNQNESTREKLFKIDREIKEMLDAIRVMEILYPSIENLLDEEDKKNYANLKDKTISLMAVRKAIGDLYFMATGEIIVPCWEKLKERGSQGPFSFEIQNFPGWNFLKNKSGVFFFAYFATYIMKGECLIWKTPLKARQRFGKSS